MKFTGTGVCGGIALGKAYIRKPQVMTNIVHKDGEYNADNEIMKYDNAVKDSLNELELLMSSSSAKGAEICRAHSEIVSDPEISREIKEMISGGSFAEDAVRVVYNSYIAQMKELDDSYLSARAADIEDVRNRVVGLISGRGRGNGEMPSSSCILVTEELTPTEAAGLDPKIVTGIVTSEGGAASHTAIIAASKGIPAVLGVQNICARIKDGERIIIDGDNGEVFRDCSDEFFQDMAAKKEAFDERANKIEYFKDKKVYTSDGIAVDIMLNISSVNDMSLNGASFSDGIGLFRTEFLLSQKTMPDENTQFAVYKRLLECYGDKPVVLRIFDIGGDKSFPCLTLPHEVNPMLGVRGIRFMMRNPEFLRAQLRAALRASVYGNLWIMFPMVASSEDIDDAISWFSKIENELSNEGIEYNKSYKKGVMIEVPSVAVMAELVSPRVDFACIGTNDLCQYLMAADRCNVNVSGYYNRYSPSLYRLIKYCADSFNRYGKEISVCGELAADPMSAVTLYGMGIKRLSMGENSFAAVKSVLSSVDTASAQKMAETVLKLPTTEAISEYYDNVRGIYEGNSVKNNR